jgi:lipopolysaccharide export system protein LptA
MNSMLKRLLFLILVVLSMASGSFNVHAKDEGRGSLFKGSEGKPIRIDSDRLEAYKDKNLVEFSGNVVAIQEDKVIKSDHLVLYFKNEGVTDKIGSKNMTQSGEVDRIEAQGNVRITERERIVTGDKAIFYNGEQKIIVTGNPVMQEGENVLRGDKIIVLLNENRGVVESNAGKRVSATIYPREGKDGKKK